MKLKSLLLALSVSALISGHALAQAPIVIKFSHVVANDTPKGKAAERHHCALGDHAHEQILRRRPNREANAEFAGATANRECEDARHSYNRDEQGHTGKHCGDHDIEPLR